jgi:hypothetical protein
MYAKNKVACEYREKSHADGDKNHKINFHQPQLHWFLSSSTYLSEKKQMNYAEYFHPRLWAL